MPGDVTWRNEAAADVPVGDVIVTGPDSRSEIDSNERTDDSGGHGMVRIETQDGCVLILPAFLEVKVGSVPGVERI